MTLQQRHRGLALLLSLVPGWGHVYWGRERFGLLLFTFGAILGFAFLNALIIYHGPARPVLQWVFGVLFVSFWVGCFADLCLRSSARRAKRDRETTRMLLDQGTIAYLHSDFVKAKECFHGALRIWPQNVEAMFRLGVVCLRNNEPKEGRRWLRTTIRHDLEDKWLWEVQRELKRLADRERVDRRAQPPEKKEETEQASA